MDKQLMKARNLQGTASAGGILDVGLRHHMLGIYRNIGFALIISVFLLVTFQDIKRIWM